MPRFFVDKNNIDLADGVVTVDGEDARHISRSLRMAVGEQITVCDGEGTEHLCRLEQIRDSGSVGRIISSTESIAESPCRISIYQALVKGDRMDIAIQKSVEFGAYEICPFEASRCIVKSKGADDSAKTLRRNKIALEAAKQCGRGIVPKVLPTASFAEMLKAASEAQLAIFCYEDEHTLKLGTLLSSLSAPPATVAIVIGPEGGFSPEEAERAVNAGLRSVSLGSRILRTESAAAFALACIAEEFELK
jgi:16S rRNA (uracil1498-N3)-methyltransferase